MHGKIKKSGQRGGRRGISALQKDKGMFYKREFGDNGRIGFSFYLATLFRDVVTYASAEHWFPILNLFGPKGSGKSELGHTLLSLFTIAYKAPNIQNSTISALNDMVATSANALAHIDEYKNDLDPKVIEFLKGLWDGTGRSSMNMDLDKKKEVTAVDAGIILSGQEMPTADIALFSRLIFLQFPRSTFHVHARREKELYATYGDAFGWFDTPHHRAPQIPQAV